MHYATIYGDVRKDIYCKQPPAIDYLECFNNIRKPSKRA